MVKKIIIAASVLGALGFTGIANADTPATTTVSAFTQCMRQHGLPDFPEIDVTDGGQVHLELTGTHVNPLSQVYGAAVKACESQLPGGALLPTAPKAPSAVP
ncbi:MAG: hypothetical protein HOY71_34540, partial [Nonomuraea sp.]|nr:hypothetical protein [Nonomuraea sp.]